jgi:hypothetical protein
MRFVRRPELPDGAREAVDRREGVLAWAEAVDGTWVVATRVALVLASPSPAPAAVRLPWETVHRADWDQESATLTVERVQDYGRPVSRHVVGLASPGAVLDVVRERVTASVVLQRRVDLGRRRGFTVIARRPPSDNALPGSAPPGLRWAFEFDPGVDPDDPTVASVADQALREAQESLGL